MALDVAYVTLFRVWPPYSGASSVTWGSVSHSGGRRALVQVGANAGRDVAEGVRIVTIPGAHERWRRLAALPFTIRRVARELRAARPRTIVVEGASWAFYSWLLTRALRSFDPRPRILYHAHNVEYLLRKGREGRLIAWLTRWAEGRVLRSVDQAYAVSELEVAQFDELYGIRPALWPNGVDASRYAGSTAPEARGSTASSRLPGPLVLFLGGYEYKPNAEAVDFLVGSVFPELRRRLPAARLLVLGGEVPHSREWLVAPGEVPHADLPAWVRSAAVGVAPVFSGAGTRVKILEYMAAGLPVVSTAKGAEGLGLKAGEDFLRAEDEAAFSAALERLLADRDLAGRMGARGRAIVRERFDWPVILQACGLGHPDEA